MCSQTLCMSVIHSSIHPNMHLCRIYSAYFIWQELPVLVTESNTRCLLCMVTLVQKTSTVVNSKKQCSKRYHISIYKLSRKQKGKSSSMVIKSSLGWVPVAHAYNTSYLGVWDGKTAFWDKARQKDGNTPCQPILLDAELCAFLTKEAEIERISVLGQPEQNSVRPYLNQKSWVCWCEPVIPAIVGSL
jgi:hypothetical protein